MKSPEILRKETTRTASWVRKRMIHSSSVPKSTAVGITMSGLHATDSARPHIQAVKRAWTPTPPRREKREMQKQDKSYAINRAYAPPQPPSLPNLSTTEQAKENSNPNATHAPKHPTARRNMSSKSKQGLSRPPPTHGEQLSRDAFVTFPSWLGGKQTDSSSGSACFGTFKSAPWCVY